MKLFRICCFLLVAVVLLASACNLKPERSLILATTTSTYDSGLLDVIIPLFEEENNVKVRVIAVGTGQALALGARGDADVVLVHAPQKEEQFVADGFGVDRTYVMYNDFVVLGPPDDPAGIKGLGSVAEAFRRIAETRSTFASRGDESGTHTKEMRLWAEAGIDSPEDEDWYKSLGQGMGGTLTTANEMRAYTLSDRGTYLARTKLDLVVLTEGDEMLFNPYHVMIVNPEKFPNVQAELARLFVDFLLSEETRQAINEFGRDKYGQGLFTPVDVRSTGE
ncbi:MAG: substrate-binding domain-containing protein [Chloroflexi bacterium]|nr:substrate-binding domain-containing protein [Chloroflexota bacterium]